MRSSATWVGHFEHVTYRKPPPDRTRSQIRWMAVLFLVMAAAMWVGGL